MQAPNNVAASGSESGAAAAGLQPADFAPVATLPQVAEVDARVQQWKAQHKEVTEIRVKISAEDEAICYLKRPDRNILAVALTRAAKLQMLEAGEFLLLNCWLGGDDRCNPASANCLDSAVVAAAIEAAQSVEMLAASSKKL